MGSQNEEELIHERTPLFTGKISWYSGGSIDEEVQEKRSRRIRVLGRNALSLIFCILFTGVIAWLIIKSNETDRCKQPMSSSSLEQRIEALKARSTIDNVNKGAVASDHPTCSQIGLTILQDQHGNAVDAAIATALCLGVVNPSSSGLGGGHFMMIHMQEGNNSSITEFIDSRETAPLASYTTMYENETEEASLIGGLAVAVWGELRGLELAHSRHGRIPWELLVAPSISLAEHGILVNKNLARAIQSVISSGLLEKSSSANLKRFLMTSTKTSSYLKEGDILKQPILANTLRQVAKYGSKVLYEGPLAEAMLKELNEEHRSIITQEDLSQYTPKIREPLIVSHNIMGNDFTFVGAPPPSSGGGVVLGILRMMSGYFSDTNLVVQRNGLSQHLLIEAFKHAFAIRMSLSDPDYSTPNTTTTTTTTTRRRTSRRRLNEIKNKALDAINDLISSNYMEFLRTNYTRMDQVLPLHYYGGPKWSLLTNSDDNITNTKTFVSSNKHENPDRRSRRLRLLNYLEDHGTTHFSVVDKDRNAVSFSSTINTEFGSGIFLKSAGIILNNEMDDFATPGRPNTFGLAPAEANYIQPGKRPLSSMSPMIVFHNSDSSSGVINEKVKEPPSKKLFLVLGASGGPRIITAVVQVVVNYMVFGMSLNDAVAHPRIHDQLLYNNKPYTLYDENVTEQGYGVSETTKQSLSRRGHSLSPTSYTGTCQAVAIDIETDKIEAASDIRKGGIPAGY